RRFDRLPAQEQRREAIAFLRCAQTDGHEGTPWDRDGKVRVAFFHQGALGDLDVEYLDAFPELEDVNLYENSRITSAGLLPLAGPPPPHPRHLRSTAVPRLHALEGLVELPDLRVSYPFGPRDLDDEDTGGLESLTRLEVLDLSGTSTGAETLRRCSGMTGM